MALVNILETINKEAAKEVEKIKLEGKKRISALEADFAERKEKSKEEILLETRIEAQRKTEQEKFKAENEKKSEILKEKQKILQEVYALAAEQMAQIPKSEQVGLLSKLIKSLPKDKEGKLIPTKASSEIVKQANEKCGHPFKVSPEGIEGKGGFIFSSPTLEIDNRYSALVKEVRSEVESEIAKTLFAS